VNVNDNAGNVNDNAGNVNANDNAGNVNANDNGSGLAIVGSFPPDGAIDARQPSDLDGSNPAGWDSVDLFFNGDTSGLTPADFATSAIGGMGSAPDVVAVIPAGNTATVELSDFIVLKGWTTITHVSSGTSVRLGYLPADESGDATSAVPDLLSLIYSLNGVVVRPEYSTDIDRSGLSAAPDVLREIDLLNGAGSYDPFLLVSLPNINGNDNGNVNVNDNTGNVNDNTGNVNVNDNTGNVNVNDNAGNVNVNDNTGNVNDNTGNVNVNDNAGNVNDNAGNVNANDNAGNVNDNTGNVNVNDNAGNVNDNTGNVNVNDNAGNVNVNDNSNQICPDGSLRVTAILSGQGPESGSAEYRLETDGRERFKLDVAGFAPGTYPVVVDGVTVAQVVVGDNGSGSLDLDSNDGNFPPNFPAVQVGDVVSVGTVISGSFELNCS
jgi:hypothetical protein